MYIFTSLFCFPELGKQRTNSLRFVGKVVGISEYQGTDIQEKMLNHKLTWHNARDSLGR